MQVSDFLSSAVVRRKLHGADTGTLHALLLTGTAHVDVRKRFGQGCFLGGDPVRDGTHRAERAPGAWRIDEIQRNAYNGSHYDNRPEHTSYATPHSQSSLAPGNGECQLKAEHAKDEAHHEQAEAEGTHKLGNRTVR